MALSPFTIDLDNGRAVPAVQVPPEKPVWGLANAFNLPTINGAIAVVGGAASFDQPEYLVTRQQVTNLLQTLADIAISRDLAIVDGGTPYGVMRLVGDTCAQFDYRFPLIGVAPSGQVTWNPSRGINYFNTWHTGINLQDVMRKAQKTPLDENHSAFVLVEANDWGDEVEKLAEVAHELAGGGGTLEVLINGGTVARHDVTAYLAKGGTVIVVEGSGRFADELAAAMRTGYTNDPELQALLATNRIHLFNLQDSPQLFASLLLRLGRWT